MKRLIVIIFMASLLFAVKSVPRTETADEEKETKTEIVNEEKAKKPNDHKVKTDKKDHFKDADSNSVNDNREDDLQMIKQLKTKFKDLFRKKTSDKQEEPKKKPSQPQKKSK